MRRTEPDVAGKPEAFSGGESERNDHMTEIRIPGDQYGNPEHHALTSLPNTLYKVIIL